MGNEWEKNFLPQPGCMKESKAKLGKCIFAQSTMTPTIERRSPRHEIAFGNDVNIKRPTQVNYWERNYSGRGPYRAWQDDSWMIWSLNILILDMTCKCNVWSLIGWSHQQWGTLNQLVVQGGLLSLTRELLTSWIMQHALTTHR